MSAANVFSTGLTALITGGAQGIGFALAQLCAKHGMHVLLADRNESALQAAQQSLAHLPGRVSTAVIDVTQEADWSKLHATVASTLGGLNLLILNAGIMTKGTWDDADYFRNTFEVNVYGVSTGIRHFLPLIKETSTSGPTSIVITGSKQGITNPPGNVAYNASKAAVKAMAQHLDWELRHDKTSVHLLVPGWTFTPMTSGGSGDKPPGAWTAGQVADHLYERMRDNKFYAICPDNDVTEEMDKKRIRWSAEEMINNRTPLSRWREDGKAAAQQEMDEYKY